MNNKLDTLDLVGIAQITGANKLVTRVSDKLRFGLSEDAKKVFKGTHIDLDKLDKFKDSECVWLVDNVFFDNYDQALYNALLRIGVTIDLEFTNLQNDYETTENENSRNECI